MSLLDEFYTKLGASSQREFHEKFMPKQYMGNLYHYTSSAGLASILFDDPKSIILWASRYDTQNDSSEGEIAIQIYKKVCKKIRETQDISFNLESIKPARTFLMKSNVDEKIKTTRPEYEEYICCFSKSSDLLPMWNYYVKGNAYEGYSIGFDITKLKESLIDYYQDIEVSSEIYPVIYDEKKQNEMVESFLQKVFFQYNSKDDAFIRYAISNQLVMWQLLFKSKFFKHENEVRVIIRVAKPSLKNEAPFDINYRTKGMYIIPYIKMRLDKKCLSSIMIGPQQWNETQKFHQVKIIKEILKRNQYSADVACSEIPVRY